MIDKLGKPKKPKKPKRKPSAYNKHIGREMRAGKTMKQAAASWKKKGSKPKPKSASSRRSSSTTRRSNTTMGKKNSFNMNKIYGLARKAAFAAPFVAIAMDPSHSPEFKVKEGVKALTGYSMHSYTWSFENLRKGWEPYFWTVLVTSAIPKVTSFVKGLMS